MLITGGDGKIACELKKLSKCYSPGKDELDVTDRQSVKKFIEAHPDIRYVIHAAAITSVEKCETDKKLAYDVNVNGTRNIIEAIKGKKIKLIYISTPCIFDGKNGNYDENSIPQPENYYGLTKTISEEIIKSSGLDYLIIRVNFVAREEWPYPKAFTDRYGTYLFADQLAKHITDHIKTTKGLIHIVGDRKLSMFDLARITTPNVLPMTMKDYNGSAKLTIDMSMTSRGNTYSID